MLILDSTHFHTPTEIRVPFYLRAPLSLRGNSVVSICYVNASHGRPPEIVITPIDHNSWEYCYRITASFQDKRGLVFRMLDILAAMHINVLIHESGSKESNGIHEIELVVNIAESARGGDKEEFIDELQARLSCAFLEDLMLTDEGDPMLHIRPMRNLHRIHEITHGRAQTLRPEIANVMTRRLKNEKAAYYIQLPRAFVRRLADDGYVLQAPIEPKSRGKKSSGRGAKKTNDRLGDVVRYSLVCDTRDRLLRALYVGQDSQTTLLQVSHRSVPGALAGITQVIAQEFNIVHCLTRPESKERNQFVALLSREDASDLPPSHTNWLESSLYGESALAGLDLDVDFPRSMANRVTRANAVGKKKLTRYEYRTNNANATGELVDLLSMKLKSITDALNELVSNAMGKRGRTEEIIRLTRSAAYLRDCLSRHDPASALRTFFSYSFQETDKHQTAGALLQGAGMRMLTGRDAQHDPLIWDQIRARIEFCPIFIAVWSPLKGKPKRVSDWLIWELGAALAGGKKVHVIADKRVDTGISGYRTFLNQVPVRMYDNAVPDGPSSFRAQLEGLVNDIRDDFFKK